MHCLRQAGKNQLQTKSSLGKWAFKPHAFLPVKATVFFPSCPTPLRSPSSLLLFSSFLLFWKPFCTAQQLHFNLPVQEKRPYISPLFQHKTQSWTRACILTILSRPSTFKIVCLRNGIDDSLEKRQLYDGIQCYDSHVTNSQRVTLNRELIETESKYTAMSKTNADQNSWLGG